MSNVFLLYNKTGIVAGELIPKCCHSLKIHDDDERIYVSFVLMIAE